VGFVYALGTMPESIYSAEQELLQHLLRQTREAKALTQVELAHQINRPQSFVSKYESGERRLDIVELREVCRALGTKLAKFVDDFEKGLKSSKRS
jgi:ribosome-binding protein aMBF1 (putative translation factor)